MKTVIEKQLFIIKTRTSQSRKTERPLTDQERLEGWYDGAEQDWTTYKDRQNNEGHEKGRLHSMSEGFILTWELAPGDQVQAALRVRFEAELRQEQVPEGIPDEPRYFPGRYLSAWCDRQVRLQDLSHDGRFVFCTSVLGRAVMLGEDGAEDAFGHDELRQALECALENDWRSVQCGYELRKLPAPLDAAMEQDMNAAWADFRKFKEIFVEAPQEAAV